MLELGLELLESWNNKITLCDRISLFKSIVLGEQSRSTNNGKNRGKKAEVMKGKSGALPWFGFSFLATRNSPSFLVH
jgi:hypothetical protein